MDLLYLSPGSQIYIGRPAKQPSEELRAALSRSVYRFNAIAEAHLPQVYITGAMKSAGVVLVISTVADANEIAQIIEQIKLDLLNFPDFNLLVLPLSYDSDIWKIVREQKCQLR